jgi:hypothetical protein
VQRFMKYGRLNMDFAEMLMPYNMSRMVETLKQALSLEVYTAKQNGQT